MSDLFQGRTMTEAYRFISAGTAHTFTFNFQPDKVSFFNLTKWETTSALPVSIWFRDQTTDAHSYSQQVIVDSGVTGNKNFLDVAANGFTVADTSGGVPAYRALIAGVTQANPCVVTTTAAHGFQTGERVVITDLNGSIPVPRGMDPLNNQQFNIIVLTSVTFSLLYPDTNLPVDSSAFPAWVAGGRVDMISRVQQPYETEFRYDPVEYKLTAGTNVMGADSDVFLLEVIKYGQVYDLGDLLV